jgi:hypothetical protein
MVNGRMYKHFKTCVLENIIKNIFTSFIKKVVGRQFPLQECHISYLRILLLFGKLSKFDKVNITDKELINLPIIIYITLIIIPVGYHVSSRNANANQINPLQFMTLLINKLRIFSSICNTKQCSGNIHFPLCRSPVLPHLHPFIFCIFASIPKDGPPSQGGENISPSPHVFFS